MTTHEHITLRPFRTADTQAVREVILTTIDVSYAGAYGPEAIAHFKEHHTAFEILADSVGGTVVVAERDGQVVATGTLTGKGKIARVYVRPGLQGRGIGRQIMAHLERRARAEGRQSVFLNASIVARPFYEALGYRLRAAKSHTFGNGESLAYFEMDKDLGDAPRGH